jgi:DNA polymerase-1
MTNRFILVDGSSYLYRAFHAMPSLSTSQGIPTGAVYGVTNMLKSLLSEYQPTHAAVVFDTSGQTFRDELYADYKANRSAMPEALSTQIAFIQQITQALGFPIVTIAGVEADDVIGTLAKQAEKSGMSTLIFTGDKDFAQLVNPAITLIDTMKNTRLDEAGVMNKFGVPPRLIVDYLCLVGDSVDNIPGVYKVGPKTAIKWLRTYGSLTNIIAHAKQIPGKVGEYLQQAVAQFPLTIQLVTIRCDISLPYTPSQLTLTPPNLSQLRQLYTQLEFQKWLAELESVINDSKPSTWHEQTILTQAELNLWLPLLQTAEIFALNLLTKGSTIIGIALALPTYEAVYIPIAHDYLGAPTQLPLTLVLERLKPILMDARRLKLGHHVKADAQVLANYGIELKGLMFDTLLEAYVLDSTTTLPTELNAIAAHHLQLNLLKWEDIAGTGKHQLPTNQVSLEQTIPYIFQQVTTIWQLHQHLWQKLQALSKERDVFTQIEMPLLPVLVRMERHGVKLDTKCLAELSKQLASRLQQLETQAHNLAATEFNLNSPKQLQTILFDKLGLPVLKKTPKKEPSTAVEVLEELAINYPLPKLILEHRSLSKLKSTYTDALPQQVNPQTERLHTTYHQAVTVTGRLSSSNPNLQNIPIRTEDGRRIRQAFIAPPGYCLLAADYSQIELRIMAHLSGDEGLLHAFQTGQDVHRHTAAEVFNIPLTEVTADQRRQAKAINFGLIYGMQAFGLAQQLNIKPSEAQNYIDAYFARYPQVKVYMEQTRALAKQQGYVTTLFGRRLYIPDIQASNYQQRQYAERSAINAPLQGTAADIVKLAMITVDNWMHTSGLKIKMILQVHDELVFEVAETDVAIAEKTIVTIMTAVVKLKVPLLVDVGIGKNWNEAK